MKSFLSPVRAWLRHTFSKKNRPTEKSKGWRPWAEELEDRVVLSAPGTAVSATLTADNHYGLYHGQADGSGLTFVGRNEVGFNGNPGAYNWSLPETWNFEANAGEYLYVLVWDDGGPQMWAGQFDVAGTLSVVSSTSQWEYTVASGANPGENGDVPSLAEVAGVIASATWQSPTASAPNGTSPWNTIPGLSANANFIWHDTLDASSSSDSHYVIFRTLNAVVPPNPPPVAGNDVAYTTKDTPVSIAAEMLLANDSDPEGEAIHISWVGAVSSNGGSVTLSDNGTADFSDDYVTYTPPTGFTGTDSLQYRVEDASGAIAIGTVTVSVNPPDGVTGTLTADNHYGLYHGQADGSGLVFVGRNEFGAAGNPGVSNWSLPETYTFESNAGDFLYVVAWDDGGPQMWLGEFVLPGGVSLVTDLENWEFTVAGTNPGTNGNVPTVGELATVIAGATWATPTAAAAQGSQPWGAIPGFSANAQMIWHDTLAESSSSDSNYVVFRTRVPVSQGNMSPLVGDDYVSTLEDTPLTITTSSLLANDSDPDGDALRVISVSSTSTAGGTVLLNDNGTPGDFSDDFVQYTPSSHFVGTDTFNVVVRDTFGWTSSGTVHVDVISVCTVQGTLTADNHYGLYHGFEDGSGLTLVGRNEVGEAGNPGQYNWSEPESYTFQLALDEYIYVVAWDDGQWQMFAGEFSLPGGLSIVTDPTTWEYVIGTGANPGVSGDLPPLSELIATIGTATWATPEDSAPPDTSPWGIIPGLSAETPYLWADTLQESSSSDNTYVIFRTKAPAKTATPSLSVIGTTVTEGNEASSVVEFHVTLSAPTMYTVMVDWMTADGSASSNDDDYLGSGGTLIFTPGQTSQTIAIPVIGDLKVEPDEIFTLTLSEPVNATLLSSLAVGGILNDDSYPTLSIDNVTTAEGNDGTTEFAFQLTLSAVYPEPVTVTFQIEEGTATLADNDYSAAGGTLVFEPGETTKTLAIGVNGDLQVEADETFNIVLSDVVNAILLSGGGQGTILNDDGLLYLTVMDAATIEGHSGTTLLTFDVELSSPSPGGIVVSYTTLDGSATEADNDYQFTSGTVTFDLNETVKTISVLVNGDLKLEGDETFFVQLTSAPGAILVSGADKATGFILNDDLVPSNFGRDPILPAIADTVVPGFVGAGAGAAVGANGQDPNGMAMNAAGLRYFNGEVFFSSTDLVSASMGNGWGHTRFYANQLGYPADWVNGTGWVVSQMPFLTEVKDGQDTVQVVAISGPNNMRWFDKVGTDTWQGRFFLQESLTHDAANHEFVLADTIGNVTRYHDFSSNVPLTQQGKLKEFRDPAGHVTTVEYSNLGTIQGVAYWEITKVSRGAGASLEEWRYEYQQGANRQFLIKSAEYRRGNPLTVVRRAEYSYYGPNSADGDANDLKLVTIKNENGVEINREYYRYWKATDGGRSLLKMVVAGANYERMLHFGGSPFTGTDASIVGFADHYFAYDSQGRVTEHRVQGAGASSITDQDAMGTFTYSYARNPNTFATGDFNHWVYKTTEQRPNGSTLTVYANQAGAPMLNVLQADGKTWRTFYKYDGQSRILWAASPSAVSGHDETRNDLLNLSGGDYQYLRDAQGLITAYVYNGTGYLQDISLKHGETSGEEVLQGSFTYTVQTSGGNTIRPVETQTVYRNYDATGAITTSFAYQQWLNLQPIAIVTTLPTVSAGQNGPGTASTMTDLLDDFGRVVLHTDAEGFNHLTEYDPRTGAVIRTITDVGGVNAETQVLQLDVLGRPLLVRDPNGNLTGTAYTETLKEYMVFTAPPVGPAQVVRVDRARGYTEVRNQATGGYITALTRSWNDHAGRPTEVQVYFHGLGGTYSKDQFGAEEVLSTLKDPNKGTYYSTFTGYDAGGRAFLVTNPNKTVTETTFDQLDRTIRVSVGAFNYAKVVVQTNEYDNGLAGDSNLTKVTLHPSGLLAPGANDEPNRVVVQYFDWRGRLLASKSGVGGNESVTHPPIVYLVLDNLNRPIVQSQYDGANLSLEPILEQGGSAATVMPPDESLLRARTAIHYDELGQVFRTEVFGVAPQYDGAGQIVGSVLGAPIVTDMWHDRRGNVIKSAASGAPVQKMQFDGAGRAVQQSVGDGGGDITWQDAQNVTGDMLLEQVHTQFDKNGNVLFVTSLERHHDTSVTGNLSSASARVSYIGSYYDAANRVTQTVDFGTNGGNALASRPALPVRENFDGFDPFLRTDYVYEVSGFLKDTIDPRGIVTHRVLDFLGRTQRLYENFIGDGETLTNTQNRRTFFIYDGLNNQRRVIVELPGTREQITEYFFGSVIPYSRINSNDLLAVVKHPNPKNGQPSDGLADREQFSYNALGEVISKRQQNGVVHRYDRDALGRLVADVVTTLPTKNGQPVVDDSVTALRTRYDSFGRPDLLQSIGKTDALGNAVLRQFNGFGQMIAEYQQHSGATIVIGGSSTPPVVRYRFAPAAQGSRPTGIDYPNGTSIDYVYQGLDDRVSRVTFVSSPTVPAAVETYSYLGRATVVERGRPEVSQKLTYVKQAGDTQYIQNAGNPNVGEAGDQYVGLDRFGRVLDQFWTAVNNGQVTLDRFQYAYDPDSNPLYRDNLVNRNFGELYHARGAVGAHAAYDRLNRMQFFTRGELFKTPGTSRYNTIPNYSRYQRWEFDALGNPIRLDEVDKNAAGFSGEHKSKFNAQNQHEGAGFSADDEANYQTTAFGPQRRGLRYDAWNRLVSDTVQDKRFLSPDGAGQYRYDALSRLISITGSYPFRAQRELYVAGSGQVLDEYVKLENGQLIHYRRNVWSLAAANTLAMSEQRTRTGPQTLSTLYQRFYPLQDAAGNVTALVGLGLSDVWSVRERYTYDPYGLPEFWSADYERLGRDLSLYNWEYLYQGGRYSFGDRLYSVVGAARFLDPFLGRWLQPDFRDPNAYQSGDGQPLSREPVTGSQWLDYALFGAVGSYLLQGMVAQTGADAEGYVESGMSVWDASIWAAISNTPVLSAGVSLAEIIRGESMRGADLGRPLNAWDYTFKGLDVGLTVAFPVTFSSGTRQGAGSAAQRAGRGYLARLGQGADEASGGLRTVGRTPRAFERAPLGEVRLRDLSIGTGLDYRVAANGPIWVDPNLTGLNRWATFFHESVHWLSNQFLPNFARLKSYAGQRGLRGFLGSNVRFYEESLAYSIEGLIGSLSSQGRQMGRYRQILGFNAAWTRSLSTPGSHALASTYSASLARTHVLMGIPFLAGWSGAALYLGYDYLADER